MLKLIMGDGMSLRFHTAAEEAEYRRALHGAEMAAYHHEVVTYGIWADNQGKYVKTPEELNSWDPRYTHDQYVKWVKEKTPC